MNKSETLMCMMTYIASAAPLPPVPWQEDNPTFHIKGLVDENDLVRRHFTKPHIYRIGAYTGCSCGFNYGQYFEVDAEETPKERESLRRLRIYIEQAIVVAGPIELYACWDGDQEDEPDSRATLHTRDMSGERFWFEERQFLVVPD